GAIAIGSFAVNAHAGGNDQSLYGMLVDRLQEYCGSGCVHVDVLVQLVHALPDTDGGGKMNNAINTTYRALHGGGVTNVRSDKFDFVIEVIRNRAVLVDLGIEHVENANVVFVPQKFLCEVPADKPGAAGNQ